MKNKIRSVVFILVAFIMVISTSGTSADPMVNPGETITRQTAILLDSAGKPTLGTVEYWNQRDDVIIRFKLADNWYLTDAQIYVGTETPPLKDNGNPAFRKFPCKREFSERTRTYTIACNMETELGFRWGSDRSRYMAIHGDVIYVNDRGKIKDEDSFWAVPVDDAGVIEPFKPWRRPKFAGYWTMWVYHPQRGHFIDSPVSGLSYSTPTQWGVTEEGGGFDYFPGERVDIYLGSIKLGSPLADHRVTPLDIFESKDSTDPRVINLARLLQSLDVDGEPKDKITITDTVIYCLESTMLELGYGALYFTEDGMIEDVIEETVGMCNNLTLTEEELDLGVNEVVEEINMRVISAEEAKANLDKTLNNTMFRKNVGKTPDLSSSKSKLNTMRMWFPALRANNEPAYYVTADENGEAVINYGIPYYDADGNLITIETEAQPIVVAYTDQVEGVDEYGRPYGEDIFVAVSRDDGNTFKRMNVARGADRTSFTLENGLPFYGEAKKPVMAVQDNNIFVAWTSKFCKGGRPAYAIKLEDTPDDPLTLEDEYEADYPYDNPYYEEDIWGVSGPQRSVDYTEDFPEVGEVPYSCIWTARGTIVTQEMIDEGGYWAQTYTDEETGETAYYEVGDIQWFKPERLTSGRRDANQVFMGSFDGAGFAIAWQEDPEGLRPGQAKGPGPGWGGATTNHKTDIWYSYIHMDNFLLVDENFIPGGDPEHDLSKLGRPKALVPMSLPIRISDNDVLNTDNLMVLLGEDGLPVEDENGDWIKIVKEDYPEDSNGDHDGSHDYGIVYRDELCVEFVEKINQQDVVKKVCKTADGRLLDGDTGASRPNLFLQGYQKTGDNPETLDVVETSYTSAWAIFAYDESKGVGNGPPDHEEGGGPYGDEYVAECGKNSLYQSFDFITPPHVTAGTIINLPEKEFEVEEITNEDGTTSTVPVLDEYGNPTITSNVTFVMDLVVDELGEPVLDENGQPTYVPRYDENGLLQINYENARRPRFIIQGKGNMGDSRTIMMILYKEGEEGSGRPSDIMLRRVVVPTDDKGNPYKEKNILCNAWETVDLDPTDEGIHNVKVCVDGAQNVSTVMPTVTTPSMGDPQTDDPYGAVKVVEWVQTPQTLDWPSGINHYEDARAHRGALDGDFVIMGYSYTPNWAAYRNGNDKYDFFIRRSFDGGQNWTTDPNGVAAFDIVTNVDTGEPEAVPGSSYSVVNCDTFTDPTVDDPDGTGHLHYTVGTGYTPGEFEQARNLSQRPNAKSSVIEPRIVKSPGTYAEGVAAGHLTDQHRYGMYYVSYGTATNPKKYYDEEDGEWAQDDAAPMDLYYSYSLDLGETHELVAWEVNPDSDGNYAGQTVYRWDYLAKGDQEQGEAQLRMTPDGSRFYAVWVQEGYDNHGDYGSDIWFRRIMPPTFPNNVGVPETTE